MSQLTMKQTFDRFVNSAVDSSIVKTIMRNLRFSDAENTLHSAGLKVIRDYLLKYTNTTEGTKRKIDLWDMKDSKGDWDRLYDFVTDKKRVEKVKTDCKPLSGFVTHFEKKADSPKGLKQSLKSLCKNAKAALKSISKAIVFKALKVIQIVMSGAYLFHFWAFIKSTPTEENNTKLEGYYEQLSTIKERYEKEILAEIERDEIDEIDTQLLNTMEVQIAALGVQVSKEIRNLEQKQEEFEQKSESHWKWAIGSGIGGCVLGVLACAVGGPWGWALGIGAVASGCYSAHNVYQSYNYAGKAKEIEKSIEYLRKFKSKLTDFEDKFRECMKTIQITDKWTIGTVMKYFNTKTKFNQKTFPKYFKKYMETMKKAKWDIKKILILTEHEYEEVFDEGNTRAIKTLWEEIKLLQKNSGKLIINAESENISDGEDFCIKL